MWFKPKSSLTVLLFFMFQGGAAAEAPSSDLGQLVLGLGNKHVALAALNDQCFADLKEAGTKELTEAFAQHYHAHTVLAATHLCREGDRSSGAPRVLFAIEAGAIKEEFPGKPETYEATLQGYCGALQGDARKLGQVTPAAVVIDAQVMGAIDAAAKAVAAAPVPSRSSAATLGYDSGACYLIDVSSAPAAPGITSALGGLFFSKAALVGTEVLTILRGKPIVIKLMQAYSDEASVKGQLARLKELVAYTRALNSGAMGPGTFKDCDICPEMIVVPHGQFLMGSAAKVDKETGSADIATETGQSADELPAHVVTIPKPFAVSRNEITLALWDACEAEKACTQHFEPLGPTRKWSTLWHDGQMPAAGEDRQRPAVRMSWNEVKNEFLPWLQKKTGKAYRLLSEAEWEYAARAGTTGLYSGASMNVGNQLSVVTGRRFIPWSAGNVKPNAFGLENMHGNVWEFVEDCYHTSYEGAPADGAPWVTGNCVTDEKGQVASRVRRGGSYTSIETYDGEARSANRDAVHPDFEDEKTGVRVGLSLP